MTIIAYSPIAQGILTGKYGPKNRPGGLRRVTPMFRKKNLRQVAPLLQVLGEVGSDHGRTMAQTALAWLLKDPNVVVIPGAKRPRQLEENLGARDLNLAPGDLERLEAAYNAYVPGW